MKWVVAGLALVISSAALTFEPGRGSSGLIPSLDVVLLVGLTAVGAKWCGERRRLLTTFFGSAYILALLHRLASVAVPRFFGRPLRLEHDLWLLPNFVDLVFDSVPAWQAGLALVGTGAVLVAGAVLVGVVLEIAARPLSEYRALSAGLVVSAIGLSLVAAPRRSELATASAGILGAVEMYQSRGDIDRKIESATIEALSYPSDLQALAGADIYVFFVESYGRTLWRNPSYRERFEPLLAELDQKLTAAGVHTASKFVSSPVKGGGSWLAHATFQSGVECDNQICYERILDSGVSPLTAYFRRRGYRTVSVLPAVDIDPSEWPGGAFFQFEENFWQEAVGYEGPRYGWSPVPDQFAVRAFQDKRLAGAPDAPPIFAELSLTTSHPPFRRVPPYIDDAVDLDAMLARYRVEPWLRFDNSYGAFHDAAEGYTAAVGYSVRSVLDFVLDWDERPYLAILLGDHQPITTIQGPGGKQVPIHVMSRDPAIVERFVAHGFRPGLIARGGSRLRMSGLLELILRACSSGEEKT